MKAHSRYLIAIATIVALTQIGVLTSMIMGRASILRNGHEIMLKVLPVDPRDLLRGDYVRLGYDISTLPIELFEGVDPATADAADLETNVVFVRVRAGADGFWQPIAARFGNPPAASAAEGDVDIRGTTFMTNLANAKFVPVDYGIERFYLPEGEGRPIEETIRERTFRMAVAVSDSGAAQIKAFYDGDTLIYAEPLY